VKLVAIVGVLLVGCVFGTVVAVTAFGSHETNAQTSSSSNPKATFEQPFDASFLSSCQRSAMNSGHISRAAAEYYCECALPIFKQTHDMAKTASSCSKYLVH
jgi:hypothetical protein